MIKLKQLPLDHIKITSVFGHRKITVKGVVKDGFHPGVDLGAKNPGVQGDPIYAVADFKVVISKYDANGYGFYNVLEHENDGQPFCSLYGHQVKLEVSVGQTGKAGELIGHMGSSGSSTGAHLHFTLVEGKFTSTFFNKDVNGKLINSVDPAPFITALQVEFSANKEDSKAAIKATQKIVPQWKIDGEKYLRDKGYTSSEHDPEETVEFGELGAILKKYDENNK